MKVLIVQGNENYPEDPFFPGTRTVYKGAIMQAGEGNGARFKLAPYNQDLTL